MRHFLIPVSLLFLLTAVPCSAQEEDDDYIEVETLTKVVETEYILPVFGRIIDGEHKLEGCEVITYRENEAIGHTTTERSGRFDMELELGHQYTIEFRKEGFLDKRVVVDTRTSTPPAKLSYGPLTVNVSMLLKEKYEGADTDVLDLPFAMIRYDKQLGTFSDDPEYTSSMMRMNGALLLMAARKDK